MTKPSHRLDKEKTLAILLTAILFFGLAIRLIYVFQTKDIPLNETLLTDRAFDQSEFHRDAVAVAKSRWLLGESDRPKGRVPFYSYFLAIIYKLFNYSLVAVFVVQAFLGTLTCALLYFIGKETFNRTVGVISCFVASFYGLFIFYNAVLLRDSLFTFLSVFLLWLLIRLRKEPNLLYGLASGLVMGFSFLTRENILFPLILMWMWVTLRTRPVKSILAITCIFLIGIVIAFAPFLIRNYIVGKKIFMSTASFTGFWETNAYDSVGIDWYRGRGYEEMVAKCGDSFRDTLFCFIEEVKKRPATYFALYKRKVTMFLNAYEVPSNVNYYLFREFPTVLRLPLFSFNLICPLGLVGMCLGLFSKKKIGILYVFLAALTAVGIIFYIQDRLRMPVIPLFMVFASYAISWGWEEFQRERYFPVIISALAMVVILIFIKPDPSHQGFRTPVFVREVDYKNMGVSYAKKLKQIHDEGREFPYDRFLEDAVTYLEKYIEVSSPEDDIASAHFYLGLAYFKQGKNEEARREWEEVVRLDPTYWPARTNLQALGD